MLYMVNTLNHQNTYIQNLVIMSDNTKTCSNYMHNSDAYLNCFVADVDMMNFCCL